MLISITWTFSFQGIQSLLISILLRNRRREAAGFYNVLYHRSNFSHLTICLLEHLGFPVIVPFYGITSTMRISIVLTFGIQLSFSLTVGIFLAYGRRKLPGFDCHRNQTSFFGIRITIVLSKRL